MIHTKLCDDAHTIGVVGIYIEMTAYQGHDATCHTETQLCGIHQTCVANGQLEQLLALRRRQLGTSRRDTHLQP